MKSLMIRIFHEDQIKAVVMGGAYGIHREEKKSLRVFYWEIRRKETARNT
jgi:hypothetical protein